MPEVRLIDAALPPPREGGCDVLIIAGEHSGDEHGARLLEAARRKEPSLRMCAIGGPQLEAAGAQLLHDLTGSSVVGLVEVLRHYGYFKRLFEQTVAWIAMHRPKAVCFVDYPGFNLRLAARLVKEGLACKGGGEVRLLYYISPQVWAWKRKRRFQMAEVLDALAVIFPFEVAVFADTELPVTYVGHPFMQEGGELGLHYAKEGEVLLLPGSRKQAVRRIFPLLLAGWERYRQKHPGARARVIYPSESVKAVLERAGAKEREGLVLSAIEEEPFAASAALMSSGTMSLKVALAGIPGAIVYRAHPLTYVLGRILVKLNFLGMANILLERAVWPEYLQGKAAAKALAGELEVCVRDEKRIAEAAEAARQLQTLLREGELSGGEWLLKELRQ